MITQLITYKRKNIALNLHYRNFCNSSQLLPIVITCVGNVIHQISLANLIGNFLQDSNINIILVTIILKAYFSRVKFLNVKMHLSDQRLLHEQAQTTNPDSRILCDKNPVKRAQCKVIIDVQFEHVYEFILISLQKEQTSTFYETIRTIINSAVNTRADSLVGLLKPLQQLLHVPNDNFVQRLVLPWCDKQFAS